MKSGRCLLSFLMTSVMLLNTILPASAAEAAENETVLETEEAGYGESMDVPEEELEEEEAETSYDSQYVMLDSNGTSWELRNYEYNVSGGRLTLTAYKGSGGDVKVPGSAYVENTYYNKVYLSPQMWGSSVTGLSFGEGATLPSDASDMFAPPYGAESGLVSFDGTNLDTSAVKDMSYMFNNCGSLTSIDLTGFDTSSVTNMKAMFYACGSLTSLDLTGFNTDAVNDMSVMFCNCKKLQEVHVESFHTGAVQDMSLMFAGCNALTYVDVSGFDTSAVKNMQAMFHTCNALTSVDVSGFDTSGVLDMSVMFSTCESLRNLDVSGFDTSSVRDMNGMFHYCRSLTALDVSGFDTADVTNMAGMFDACTSLTALDVSGFDTSSVTDMTYMFCSCHQLKSLDVSHFITAAVTAMGYMFYDCLSLKSLNLSSFNTESVTRMDIMFQGCKGITELDLGSFDMSSVTNADSMLTNMDNLKSVRSPRSLSVNVALPGSGFKNPQGEEVTALPQNLTYSVLLSRGTAQTQSISDCTISLTASSYVYTGEDIIPGVTVKKGTQVLTEGTDYYLTGSNNRNAGTATVVITGTGSYTGSVSRNFTITKADQNIAASLSVSRLTAGETAGITVTGNKGELVYASSNAAVASVGSDGLVTALSAGEAVITVTARATSNYNKATAQVPVTVLAASQEKDIAACTVTLAQSSFPYTGADIVPGLTVKDEGKLLSEGTDYTLTCSSNRNAGTASVLVAGKGNYTGSVTKYFTITRIDQDMKAVISDAQLSAGETAKITVTGNKGDLVFASSNAAAASVDAAGLVTALSAGEAVITVTAKMTVNYNKAVVQIPVTVEAAGQETGRSIEEISYAFSNSASAFSYPSGYKIPLSSYQIIYGDNTRAEAVYMAHSRSAWGGNCSGLAATSALMTTAGGGVWPHSFKTGASAPRDLAVTDTSSALSMNLTTFVEAMHIAQYTEAFSNERKAHVVYTSAIQAGNKNLDSLYNAVKSKAESDIPTVLALVQAGGHAVLAYKTQEVSSTESRVYIYDSNFPLQDRYITFYKNDGHYTQWSYDMGGYGEWGTDSSASSISYIAYATLKSIWDNRGNVGKDEASLAFVNSQNFAVYDVKGNLEAVFSGGSLSDYTGKISRISDELSLKGGGTQEVVLSIPTKTHTIVNLDRTLSSFAVTVVDTDLGISVDTTVQEVTLSVDDEYSVSSLSMDAGTGDSYSVTLSNSFASGYDKVEVSGTGQGETLSISQSGTSLNFSNCDISLLMVDGQQVGVYEITASATEGGGISPSGTTSLRQGESLSYTITPDTGYVINEVYVDGVPVGAVSTYTFTRATAGHSILATFKKAQTTLETPKVSSVTNVKNGVKIAWGKVEGAENYRIYVKANGGGWKRLTETAGTSYTWTGAESGNTYGFTIRCMNAAATSFTSGYDNTGKSVTYIAAPSITKLESLAGGVKITWTKSAGAQLYRIYYREGSGSWKKLTDTTSTSYTWSGAEGGKTYGFTLRCMNSAGTSFTSGYDDVGKSITYKKPAANPEVTSLSAVTGGLKIDWSSYQGAGVYAVYYKTGTGAGGWKKLVNVSGTSYTWTGAVDGTTYSFTVRAMNDAGTSFVSGYNNTGMSIAYKAVAAIPRVTSVTNVQGGVKIAWSAFTGAGSYRIFYKESGGSWKKLCDASGTSYIWTGAVSGSFYAFTVRALNAAGTSYVSGYDNTGRSITCVAAPVITTLKKVSGGIQIGWGTCAGAGSYRIFVKVNGGGWKKLTDVSGTSYTWKGAAAGNTYGFTVRCMDAGSTSFVSGYDNTGKSLAF